MSNNEVKVWNDNTLPFRQEFKGDVIEIPAKGYIMMPYEEAVGFKSYPFPMKFDGMGQQLPESFKMLRVEPRPADNSTVVMFRCHRDGSLHASKDALSSYEAKLAETHASEFADADGVAIAKRGRKLQGE